MNPERLAYVDKTFRHLVLAVNRSWIYTNTVDPHPIVCCFRIDNSFVRVIDPNKSLYPLCIRLQNL